MKRYLVALLVLTFSTLLAGDMKKVDLTVSGMHCSSCSDKVKSAIKKVSDVKSVDVNLKKGTAKVTLASNSTTGAELLAQAIADAGYSASYKEGTETKSIAAVKADHQREDCDEKGGDKAKMDCKTDGKADCCMGKTTKTKEVKRK